MYVIWGIVGSLGVHPSFVNIRNRFGFKKRRFTWVAECFDRYVTVVVVVVVMEDGCIILFADDDVLFLVAFVAVVNRSVLDERITDVGPAATALITRGRRRDMIGDESRKRVKGALSRETKD